MLYKPCKSLSRNGGGVGSSSSSSPGGGGSGIIKTPPAPAAAGAKQQQQHHHHHHRWHRLGNFLSSLSQLTWFGGSHNNLTTSGSGDAKADAEQHRQKKSLQSQPLPPMQQRPSFAVSCQNLHQAVNRKRIGGKKVGVDSTTSIDDEEDVGGGGRPGADQVAKWATGFEHLLADIDGVSVFAEFLRGEFSEENIDFWLAVEEYRKLTDSEELLVAARRIARTHIGSDAPASVNLDGATVRHLQSCLRPDQQQPPDASLFDAAQKQIFSLMRLDSYTRFLKSPVYKDCLLCELESRPLPTPPGSLLRSRDSLAASPVVRELRQPKKPQPTSAGKWKLQLLLPRSSAEAHIQLPPPEQPEKAEQPPPTAAYRSRQPSFIVAALDLDCSISVC